MDLEDRFWDKVDRRGKDECWEWKAGTTNGYGYIWMKERNGMVQAHRVSYLINIGDIEDRNINHTCHNRTCVNPNHLYSGSQKENMHDAIDRGTHQRGEEKSNSKLTKDDVVEIKTMLDDGITHRKIAEKFGVSRASITYINLGINWSHVAL